MEDQLKNPSSQAQGVGRKKIHPKDFVFYIVFLFVLMAGGALVCIAYPVRMFYVEDPFWLPSISALAIGLLGGFIYPRLVSKAKKFPIQATIFTFISFAIIGFWIFDFLMTVAPSLFSDSHRELFTAYLYEPKFILYMFVGGVGGIFALMFGIISLLIYVGGNKKGKSLKPILALIVYGVVGMIVMQVLLGAGTMDDSIAQLKAHPQFDFVISFLFGGSFFGYALLYLKRQMAEKTQMNVSEGQELSLDKDNTDHKSTE